MDSLGLGALLAYYKWEKQVEQNTAKFSALQLVGRRASDDAPGNLVLA